LATGYTYHSVILELNLKCSYRAEKALEKASSKADSVEGKEK